MGTILAACTDSGEPGEAAAPLEPADVPLCEARGIPCDWSEAGDEAWAATLDLLETADARLEAGDAPAQVARALREDPRVAEIRAEPGGVLMRVDGGMPVVAFGDAAAPALDLSRAGGESSGRNADAGWALPRFQPEALIATARAQGRDKAPTFRTTNEPGERPRSALVLSPFHTADPETAARRYERETDESGTGERKDPVPIDKTRQALEADPRFVVHAMADEQATTAHFRDWSSHDIVVVETHGWLFTCEDDQLCGLMLAGAPVGETALPSGAGLKSLERRDLGMGVTIAKRDGAWRYAYMESFFQHHYGAGLGGTVVILNVCDLADDYIVDALGGDGAVFAWKDRIEGYQADAITAELVRLLGKEGVDAATAMERLDRTGRYTTEFIQTFTTKVELAVLKHIGANLRARDAVTAYQGNAELQAGDDITALGTPEDGEPDRIRELRLRIDGVLEEVEDSARIELEIDGQRVALDEAATRLGPETRVSTDDELPWHAHELVLEDIELPFDLERADVTGSRPHRLRVDVDDGGGPSRHEADPVYFRMGQVRAMHPETTQELADGDEVTVEGRAGDGRPEQLPVILRLDYLNERLADEHAISLQVGGDTRELKIADLERIDDGFYRYQEGFEVGDVPDDNGLPVRVEARLTLEGERLDQHLADPVHVRVEPSGMTCVEVIGAVMGMQGALRATSLSNFYDGYEARFTEWADELGDFHERAPRPLKSTFGMFVEELQGFYRRLASARAESIPPEEYSDWTQDERWNRLGRIAGPLPDLNRVNAGFERISAWVQANC